VKLRQFQNLFFKQSDKKTIKITHKICLISIIIFCFPQTQKVLASTEPIISVLILKDKKIRIRSDKSIPLIIKGKRFANKKIKGLTLKKQNNKNTLFLPAFGDLTGGYPCKKSFKKWAIVSEEEIIEIKS